VRSSFYKWLDRKPTEEERINKIILTEIYAIHEEFNGIYGYRRMKINVNRRLGSIQPQTHLQAHEIRWH